MDEERSAARGEVERVPPATERLPSVFQALDRIIGHTLDVLPRSRDARDRVEFIRLKIFSRAFNAVKGIKLLLEHDHWELAAPLVRQLYEILVNLEELQRSEEPDAAAERYLRFAAVQDIRHQVASRRYDIATGRRSTNERPTPEDLELFSLAVFPDFVSRREGRIRWARTWTGKTTRELAQISGEFRLQQYETLFSLLSSEAHGSPVAAVGGFAELTGGTAPSVDERVRRDSERLTEIASLAATLFLQIWIECHPPIEKMPRAVPEELDALAVSLLEAYRSEEGNVSGD